jgi:antitoxin component of MazEF toxin-antitoxin module
MHTVKITSVGDNVEIVLPKSALGHISMSEGEQLQVHVTERGVELTACDDDFQRQLEIAEKIMVEDHDVLRKLAQ